MTDEDIVLRVQAGEADPFGLLIERYEPKMARYARRFFHDRDGIKDLVQDVFIKAYANIQSFDTGRRFSSWLYRIAHNEFVNALKKRSRFSFISLDPDAIFPHPAAKETADAGINAKEIKDMLDLGLKNLDEKYREPLILHYFEELDYREIAEIMQLPMGTVGVRLRRGRELLKNMLDKENKQ